MADVPTTTSRTGTESLASLLTDDQLAFRFALDKLFKALRADWLVHENRKLAKTEEGQKLGHHAALAWSEGIDALTNVMDTPCADADLTKASAAWLDITAERFPDRLDVMHCGSMISSLFRKHRKSRPDLAALLQEAHALTEAYSANLALMSMQRAAD